MHRSLLTSLIWRSCLGGLLLLLGLLVGGCRTAPGTEATGVRPFVFAQDTFAFANELKWEYQLDPATGELQHRRREPVPEYHLRCFVLTRAVRLFFQHARFAPDQPEVETATYQELLRALDQRSPRQLSSPDERIVIPGYADLRAFSAAQEPLLKAELGGVWESYLQRGHWRMIFPLTRSHQAAEANQLLARLRSGIPPVVHVVRFPALTINHALVIYEAAESADELRFSVYDPNAPAQPVTLTYRHADRRFYLPANEYFIGGRVDVYEIYHQWNY